tara:strand:+ start:870 stop:1448 length:579 start_codon:yes stop_codon:yes gene_type:complete
MPDEPNIKKLILQSQYVIEEFEETKEKMDRYLQELYEEFPDEYNQMMAARNPKGDNQEVQPSDSLEDDEDEHELDTEKKPPSMRKLYRRISKITHPDKIESEFLNEYFKKASAAYAENNISELITIASFLNIDTSDVDKEQIAKELKGDIFTKQFFIANTKSSLAWRWANADTEKEKEDIRKIIKEYAKENY